MTKKQTKEFKKLEKWVKGETVAVLRNIALQDLAKARTATNPVSAARYMHSARVALGQY